MPPYVRAGRPRVPMGDPADRRSAPAELRGEVSQDAVEEAGVVVDAELVGDGEEQGVGGGDRLVVGEFLHQLLGLAGVGLAEPGRAAVEVPDLIVASARRAEVRPVQVSAVRVCDSGDRDQCPNERNPILFIPLATPATARTSGPGRAAEPTRQLPSRAATGTLVVLARQMQRFAIR